MPQFECKEQEIKLLQRLRALERAGFDRALIGLHPMAIIEKIDSRLELIERPPAIPPAAPAPQV